MKSGTHKLKNMKQSEVVHILPTLGDFSSSCTFLHASRRAVFEVIPGHAPTHPPHTRVSMKRKTRWELHHIHPQWAPLFPLLLAMHLHAFSGLLEVSRPACWESFSLVTARGQKKHTDTQQGCYSCTSTSHIDSWRHVTNPARTEAG